MGENQSTLIILQVQHNHTNLWLWTQPNDDDMI